MESLEVILEMMFLDEALNTTLASNHRACEVLGRFSAMCEGGMAQKVRPTL